VVSRQLGHSSDLVTATVYAHALPQDEIAAADIWEDAMKKATQSPSIAKVLRMPKTKSA
jgi:hypothetical protein